MNTSGSTNLLALLLAGTVLFSCNSHSANHDEIPFDSLSTEEKRLPENALKGITVHEDLVATLFASEPMITNPTNIDIDHRGRVWVCEAYNYRPAITGNDVKSEGDRIVILEDTNRDGKADKSTVFYQDPELNAPLGIWVMGNQVIVSQSPYVWLLTDTDGDDIADKKEILFQGIDGEQHDHGMHAFVFGPDGKFYFNFGNSGGQIKDRSGQIIKDLNGNPITKEHYKEGLVFRCNPDFSEVEVLGQNFRNNYEVAVDSYGTMWQSDNDDDGNQGVRINFVMEYGNYGYRDEMTGAGWRANRTNKEKEIPLQHWHLNDPGVVPNLLQTGAGSPTGMTIYEGDLLPEVFQGQMIHTDAGPNVVRAYPVQKDGAGYKAEIVNLMHGDRDQWFRPSDVCVAPDGSLMVADWYDPGVGGHQVGDLNRGRIFRLAPPKSPYKVPPLDFSSLEGAAKALENPNLSVRYLAWKKLKSEGAAAEGVLAKIYANHENPRIKARALWILAKTPGIGPKYIDQALKHETPEIRIVGLRAARQTKLDLTPVLSKLVDDIDPQVRREAAIALRHQTSTSAPELWAKLATQHDGKDRWYLEALGIGAERQWDRFYAAWLDLTDDPLGSASGRDIVWRSRTGQAIPHLATLASDESASMESRLRYFRAFDFNPDKAKKSRALIEMLESPKVQQETPDNQSQVKKLVLTHMDPAFLPTSSSAQAALKSILDETYGTEAYLEMVQRFKRSDENPRLLAMALEQFDNNLGRTAASTLLQQNGNGLVRQVLQGRDEKKKVNMLLALRQIGSSESIALIESVAFDESMPLSVRREAASAIGGSYSGEDRVLELLKQDKFPENLKASAVTGVSRAWRKSVRAEANAYLATDSDEANPLPPLNELLAKSGDIENGKSVFRTNCAVCHQVGEMGMDFGPKLTEIGSKLSKEAQYLSILHPDAGISFGYEGYVIEMKDGSTLGGIIASQTETDIDLKMPGGTSRALKTSDIHKMTQMESSMMPSGLEKAMSTEELVDLVEYLMSLKRNS
ncbi:MAG: c-type cytochrome [Lunatimonas sp.]|uniref:PVC-type heme-binding CxxCH protein n=1 Tax=Lunatimonas sp. TaxID=2060141 RepID=UPI00263B2891|nr:PVC-type heme-binding CxxCH protein [Lunatimonas sp.]MCC5937189.1 c-type cytochrome [Lunatimonas sp.]